MLPCLQVAALQTEAVLDVLTDEWVINTPDEGAIKWWIGNAAEDGKAATVFARLKVPAQDGEQGGAHVMLLLGGCGLLVVLVCTAGVCR